MELQSISAQLNRDRVLVTSSGLSQRLSALVKTVSVCESLLRDDSIIDCLQLLRNNIKALEELSFDPKTVDPCKSSVVTDLTLIGIAPSESINSLCSYLMDNICNPLLRFVFMKEFDDCVVYRLTVEVCLLIAACMQHIDSGAQADLMTALVSILSNHAHVSSFQLIPLIRTLSKMYSFSIRIVTKEITSRVFDIILEIMFSREDEPLIGELLTLLIPSISSFYESFEDQFSRFWSNVLTHFDTGTRAEAFVTRALFILCGLLEIYLTMTDLPLVSANLIGRRSVWSIVQQGFCHSDSLSRKRALYIFRRILDFSASETNIVAMRDSSETSEGVVSEISLASLQQLQTVWQEFILLVEMLEEKQVIRDVCLKLVDCFQICV